MPGLIHFRDSNSTLTLESGSIVEDSAAWQDGSGNPRFLPTVLHAVWIPADVTQSESTVVLTIPAGAILLGAYLRVPCPADTSTDSVIEVSDAQAEFDAGTITLSVDTWTGELNALSNQLVDSLSHINPVILEDDDVTVSYDPGLTPGETVPVVYVDVLILPGVLA